FKDQLVAATARALEQPERQQLTCLQQHSGVESFERLRELRRAGAQAAPGRADPFVFGLAAKRPEALLEPARQRQASAPVVHRRADVPDAQDRTDTDDCELTNVHR